MNGLVLRAVGGLAGLLALAALGFLVKDRFHQKALADDAKACAVAAADPEDAKPLDRCLDKVAVEVRAARQSRICEKALLPQLRDETRGTVELACGAGVRRLVLAFDTITFERDQAEVRLGEADDAMARAVARAEARNVKSSERESHGRQVIQAAPRDAAGSIVCDADCLRRLTE